jgi:hypothetical protein
MINGEDYEIAETMSANFTYLQSVIWEALSMRLFLKKKGLLKEYIEDQEIGEKTDELFDKALKELENEED